MPASEVIDLGRPIRGANCDAAERRLQGLQEILTEPRPAAIASSGSSGKFDKPSIAAISLNKKSRMKKD